MTESIFALETTEYISECLKIISVTDRAEGSKSTETHQHSGLGLVIELDKSL